ncbi:MAG: hypothetical protein COA96_18095 [SAR86 cluster bacterium]|uniref:GGDEF domain-containing protein n=1 Tax=SAR86 cluster bacterium TaxID=2030880 RepID=A0A2A5ACA4_9GAMM|nr:MAG: hypothetical protein COA96_18095 [SAR86 cluster bacterium]
MNKLSTTRQAVDIPADDGLFPRKDPLTGLYEQDYLSKALNKVLKESRRRKISATLGLLQLENFYEIRSWVGKSEADLLLGDIARVLKKTLPKNVLLCRCRHYEFGILLLNDSSVNAVLITDRVKLALLSAVSASIPAQLEMKCGVGLARVESSVPSIDVMFARARHNLSLAHYQQNNERPRLIANPEVALNELMLALRENKLKLSFQPIVSLKEDGLAHYEIRCYLPNTPASLPTRVLFDTAANNALGEDIDRRVIEKSLNLLKKEQNDSLRLTINLTHNSLVNPQFLSWLEAELATCSTLAKQLIFQVSEIDVLIAQHHLNYFCEKLTQLDIKLCINNFGCTIDPFRYLPLLQAHFVKLDVSRFEKINISSQQFQQLVDITSRLHDSGLGVIVAMVEQMTLLPLLWQAQVDFVQGYALQKPKASLCFNFLKEETLGICD